MNCYETIGMIPRLFCYVSPPCSKLCCYIVKLHYKSYLTHWDRVTHICVGKLTIIVSDNGLSPERRQAIIWTNAGILLIGPLETNFSESLFAIETFSFRKMHFKISSAKWRSFCLGLNVLRRLSPTICNILVLSYKALIALLHANARLVYGAICNFWCFFLFSYNGYLSNYIAHATLLKVIFWRNLPIRSILNIQWAHGFTFCIADHACRIVPTLLV